MGTETDAIQMTKKCAAPQQTVSKGVSKRSLVHCILDRILLVMFRSQEVQALNCCGTISRIEINGLLLNWVEYEALALLRRGGPQQIRRSCRLRKF